jgi:hypothetical protein
LGRTDAMSVQALRNVRYVATIQETSGTQNSSNSAWVTLVSITSTKGWIYQIRASVSITSATNPQLRITIDGGTPQTFQIVNAAPQFIDASSTETMALPIIGVRFDSSMLIEYMQTNATAVSCTGNLIWGSR